MFATGEVAGIMRQKDEGDQEMQISSYTMNESQLWHVWCGTCHKENKYVLFYSERYKLNLLWLLF